MKEIFAFVLEFMLTLAKIQNNVKKIRNLRLELFEIIQAFHTVCIFCISGVLAQWSGPCLQHIDFI